MAPKTFRPARAKSQQLTRTFGRPYAALGKACSQAGPIDGRTARLVKLALAVGALSEGAVHSHRRALEEGSPKRS